MKDDRLYLIHISECIERIESYVTGRGESAFLPVWRHRLVGNLRLSFYLKSSICSGTDR